MLQLKEYEYFLKDNELGKNTIKNYLTTLRQLDDYIVSNDFSLDKETLIEFKQYLKDFQYKSGKNYKLKTINQKLIIVNVYLKWLETEGYISDRLSVKLLKSQTKEHRESITEADYKRLLKNSTTEEMRLFILVIGNTGMRISEVCSFKVEDLNKKIIVIENKGKQRIITIPQFLKKQLKAYVKKAGIEETIFYKNQRTYRVNLKKIAGIAKVNKEKVYPHSIRHYFAKSFLMNGGDATVLQQLLGHEQIATTTIYTKLSSNELSDQFSKIKNI